MEPAAGAAAPLTPGAVDRLRTGVAVAGLVALAFGQQPGRIVADTKADLVLAPAAFLARSLQAWDPHAAMGQLQNQAYGYLFPMGPFFLGGHALGVPAWIVQRAWWSLLLVVAFLGCRRVAALLELGSPGSRLVGAWSYAMSPMVLTVLGGISAEALPAALLPWLLVPLIRGAQGGSARRAALGSAVAFAAIGGINAAATLAVLPMPMLYLATRPRSRQRTRLVRWWLLGIVLASLWWLLPLLLLGHYAYPFLDYIETAAVTTSVTSLPDVLRGTSHWLAFTVAHQHPFWRAGWELATAPLLVAATGLVAAAGLAGLVAGRRERRFLLATLLTGTALVALGYSGASGSPLGPAVQHLLDGPLAAFRNVHKFDPLVRLPLALGLTALPRTLPLVWPRLWPSRPRSALVAGVAAVLVLGLAAAPAVAGRIANDGSFSRVPAYWTQVARYLDAHAHGQRSLLVPGAGFGEYTWGRPLDEPLTALTSAPVAVLNAVPLGAPGATRLLDAINAQLATGAPAPWLAGVLAGAGFGFVVLRNDIDVLRSGAEPPELFHSALVQSAGLRLVATFGSRAVEVFRVLPAAPRIQAVAATGIPRRSGGPEAALTLAGAGFPPEPTLAVADAGGASDGPVLVTDTLRRRSTNFGADAGSDYSPTLPASVDPAGGRPAGDVLPYDGVAHQTTAVWRGARAVRASSSAADPFAPGYRGPLTRPASAFDGTAATAWVSGLGAVGQWLEVELDRTVRVAAIRVRMLDDPAVGPPVTRLEVTTDAGRRTVRLRPTEQPQEVTLPAGATRRIRLTVRGVPGAGAVSAVGVREVSIPGAIVRESIAPPVDATGLIRNGAPAAYVFSSPVGARGNCFLDPRGWDCLPGLARPGEEAAGLDRTFSVPRELRGRASVTVAPLPGPALDRELDAALGYAATASSTLVDDPVARPGAAFDGDPATGWMPGSTDPVPTLTVQFPQARTVSSLRLSLRRAAGGRVDGVVVRAGDQVRDLPYRADAVLRFAPLTGRRFDIALRLHGGVAPLRVVEASLGPGPVTAPRTVPPVVALPCGSGPTLALDGKTYAVAARAPAAQLLALARVPGRLCDGPTRLAPGTHQLRGSARAPLAVVGVTFTEPGALGRPPAPARAVTERHWAAERRTVEVAPGAESYLVLAEGANPGWVARAGGRRLAPVRLDAWRQAWLLPASGRPVEVVLTFTPGRWHRVGLLGGAVALVLLVLGAVVRARPAVRKEPAPGPRGRRPLPRVLAVAAVAVAAVLLTGAWGLLLVPLAVVPAPRWRPLLASGGVAASALWVAVAGAPTSRPAQLLAAASVLVCVTCLVSPDRAPGLRRPSRPRSGRSIRRQEAAATATLPAAVRTVKPMK